MSLGGVQGLLAPRAAPPTSRICRIGGFRCGCLETGRAGDKCSSWGSARCWTRRQKLGSPFRSVVPNLRQCGGSQPRVY